MTDETSETPDQEPVTPEILEPSIEIEESSLEQFTYSIRHRAESLGKPFASGNFEGRMKLGTHEYIVSATTLDDLITQMTVKADSLIANGYKTQG